MDWKEFGEEDTTAAGPDDTDMQEKGSSTDDDGEEADEDASSSGTEESSDEECVAEAAAAPPQEPEQQMEPAAKRRRLRGKQAPPSAYMVPAVPPPLLPPVADDSEPEAAASTMKRPAAKRWASKQEFCTGHNGQACCFSTTEQGGPARIHPDRNEQQCIFCSKERMEAASKMVRWNSLTHALKKLKAMSQELFEQALARIRLFLPWRSGSRGLCSKSRHQTQTSATKITGNRLASFAAAPATHRPPAEAQGA